jgi:hypothetical protein
MSRDDDAMCLGVRCKVYMYYASTRKNHIPPFLTQERRVVSLTNLQPNRGQASAVSISGALGYLVEMAFLAVDHNAIMPDFAVRHVKPIPDTAAIASW